MRVHLTLVGLGCAFCLCSAAGCFKSSTLQASSESSSDSSSERWADLASQLLALRALEEARPLRADARIAPPEDDTLALTATERRKLAALGEQLAARLEQLVVSRRPDWGFALLVGMARLQALAESQRSGRLVVLDAFPPDARSIPVVGSGNGAAFLAELRVETQAAFTAARAAVFAREELDERDLSRLEDTANRLAEVARGLVRGGRIRVHAGPLLPERGASTVRLPAPALDAAALGRAEVAAREAEQAYDRALHGAFGYDLLTRNCATEIFATIESALGRRGSVERLGGWIDPRGAMSVVPLLSFRSVLDVYDVVATGEVPSYRQVRLEEMYARENPLKVYLRESNTATSTIYRHTDDDSLFLFFTDDVVPPRPLYGAANVAAGLGETLLGVVRAPYDHGRTLWSGLTGVASSLPELVFLNFRKGTMRYARGAAPGEAVRLQPTPARRLAARFRGSPPAAGGAPETTLGGTSSVAGRPS